MNALTVDHIDEKLQIVEKVGRADYVVNSIKSQDIKSEVFLQNNRRPRCQCRN